MNRWGALAFLLALAIALALRCPQPGLRPVHNDEAVNATKLAALWEQGNYQYDPHEYHGPTLYYFSLPFLWAGPAKTAEELSDGQLRIVTITFGVGLILLLLLMSDGLGRMGAVWAAVFLAVSPAMVFYSRYFIHEMLLVFFTLLTLAMGWRYVQTRKAVWAARTGVGVGLMLATKETFVLSIAAMIFALVATRLWNRWRRQRTATGPGTPLSNPAPLAEGSIPKHAWIVSPRHLAVATIAGGAIWLVFFTSFFTNATGLLDSFKTYVPWLTRAGGGSPHIHPWYFHFERLLWFHPEKSPPWSEGMIGLLAICGGALAFCNNQKIVERPGLARFLVFYTGALAAIYTIIAYKTPWCLLNFWLGAILLAGIGASALVRLCRTRVTQGLLIVLLGVGVVHLGLQAWLLSHRFVADLRNPYVYAQTSPHARELVARIKAIAGVAPEGADTVIKVVAPESYWPLPWSLREFNNVGWYEELPADPHAPMILASAKLGAALDEKSEGKWIMTGYYELRPNVFLELYVERGLWTRFVATLPRGDD